MAATDQNYRNQYGLDVVFAVSSILMLLSIIWMLVQDFQREYKTEQREFRDVEVAMAQREALVKMPRLAEFDQKRLAVEAARKQREADQPKINELNDNIRKALPEKERAELELSNAKAQWDSKISFYDIAVEQTGAEGAPAKSLKLTLQNIQEKMASAKADADKYADEVKSYQQQKDALEQPLTKAIGELKKLLDDFDRQVNLANRKQWTVADYIRSLPVIDGFASPTKIEQITLHDLTIDYNFKGVTRFDRCTSCHKGIARPTFTKENLIDLWYEPSKEMDTRLNEAREILKARKELLAGLDEGRNVPDANQIRLTMLSDKKLTAGRVNEFCVHPRLDLFVGPNSKHPMEKFGCTGCHSGQPSGTSFTFSAHTPNNSDTKKLWQKEYDWEAQHMWDFPMLPRRFVESSCLKCHHQVTDLYEDGNRSAAPKLLAGYNTISEFGCFGCHEINGYANGRRIGPDIRLEPSTPLEQMSPTERAKLMADPDNPPGTMRKVGPSLKRVSEKTYEEWARKWLLAPRQFRADTKMPHYYGLSNNDAAALAGTGQEKFPATEIHGIVHFLFKNSRDFVNQVTKAQAAGLPEQVRKLEAKDKRSPEEQKELDDAKALLALRDRYQPLNTKLAELKGDAKPGRDLFTKKGCLACHSHAATNEPDDNWPAAPSESDFAPNLTQVTEKLVKDRSNMKQAKLWLTNWLKNPSNHSPRTRMPITHLSDQEAVDIAAWLLDQDPRKPVEGKNVTPPEDIQGANWATMTVPPPDEKDLEALAHVYLVRVLPESDISSLFAGRLAPYRMRDLGADEKELAQMLTPEGLDQTKTKALAQGLALDDKGAKRDQLLIYVGRKAVGRLGCFGCHDISGYENAKSIGTGLNEWGKKDPGRLAFEDIEGYIQEHFKPAQVVDSRVDRDDRPLSVKKGPLYERFYYDALMHKSREGFLYQKLQEPRSYDFNRIRAWDDRLRMPQFRFGRVHKKGAEEDKDFNDRKLWAEAIGMPLERSARPRKAESLDDFLARKDKAEADNREAVMTFVLGLVGDPIDLKYLHRPGPDRLAEAKGRQVLDKFNCSACHTLRPGAFEFKMSTRTLKQLEELHGKTIGSPEFKDDHYFPEHRAWSQPVAAGDTATAYGVRPILLTKDKQGRVLLTLTEALRVKTQDGKELAFRAKDAIPINPGDLIYPPQSALKSIEAFYDWDRHSGVYGGRFANVLSIYLKEDHPDKNKYVEPGPFVPPYLNWQGERTQPNWLYQFLLDPIKVRELTVLRMPKFNMSGEDARALVDYFSAVGKRANPEIDLKFPYPKVPQHAELAGDYWQKQTAAYIQRLKDTKQYDQALKELTPVWNKMREEWAGELKNAEQRAKTFKDEADKLKEQEAKAQGDEKDQLKRKLDMTEQNASFWATEKGRLEILIKDKTLDALEKDWSSTEALVLAGFRTVTNQCNKCHQVGDLQAQQIDGRGPSLNLASQRLRPEWAQRWISNPQRFIPYNSAMPMYFKESEKLPLVPWLPGTQQEQVQAARDTVLNLPTIGALPLTRAWMQHGSSGGEKK
jgi:mono/diheme cytochrome c family protein